MTTPLTTDGVIITVELLQAIACAQQALRERAAGLKGTELYNANNAAGRLLREGIEREMQKADMLRGWCERRRIEARIPEEDVRYV